MRGWQPSPDDIDAYVRWKGNAAAAWRQQRSQEGPVPTLRTFQRALIQVLNPGDRATVRDGVPGRRRHQVYLRWEPDARNELWEADHTQMEIDVLFPRAQRPRRPWLTTFTDGCSRAIMGWAISDHPNEATVLAALGQGIRLDETQGPFAGVPQTLRPDGGLEFAAGILTKACGVLGIHLAPTAPYSPNLKGKVERLHDTLATQFLAQLPHFIDGPRGRSGERWGGSLPILPLGDLVASFDEWVGWYHTDRPHQGLNGQTPRERWLEDATPLRLVPDEELRWTLLGDVPRKVVTSGIRFHGLYFIAPELNGLVSETVNVRYRPHDDTRIEVFRAGRHLCSAVPQGTLTAEERAAILAQRRADTAEQARRQCRVTRQMRQRSGPATAAQPSEDLTVISGGLAAALDKRAADQAMQRMARVDLLLLPGGGERR